MAELEDENQELQDTIERLKTRWDEYFGEGGQVDEADSEFLALAQRTAAEKAAAAHEIEQLRTQLEKEVGLRQQV